MSIFYWKRKNNVNVFIYLKCKFGLLHADCAFQILERYHPSSNFGVCMDADIRNFFLTPLHFQKYSPKCEIFGSNHVKLKYVQDAYKLQFFVNGLLPAINNVVPWFLESKRKRKLCYEKLVSCPRYEGPLHRPRTQWFSKAATMKRKNWEKL